MFLFLRLLLAHFLGDTLLQPDEVYQQKMKGFYGVVIHVIIIFLTFVVFATPYLHYPATWAVLIFVGITHLIQDELKIRKFTSPKYNFIAFVIDQLFHVLFTTPILLFNFADQIPQKEGAVYFLYNSTNLVVICLGCVITVFLGAYLWEAYKISYVKSPILFDNILLKYGMFERFLILISVTFSLWPALLVPIIFRKSMRNLNLDKNAFAVNIVYASLVGFFLRNFLPIF